MFIFGHTNLEKFKLYMFYFKNSVRNRGFLNTLYFLFFEFWHEKKFKINTKSIECRFSDSAYNHYQAASYVVLKKVFSVSYIEKKAFVDVGCGKGRVLKYALYKGFSKCYGIELDEAVLQIAKENLKDEISEGKCVLWHKNVLDCALENNFTTFFLFNPFKEIVMQCFIEKLLQHRLKINEPIQVIYVNPICLNLFQDKGFEIKHSIKTNTYIEAVILTL